MITNIRAYLKRNAHKSVLWIVMLALGFGSLPTFVRKTTKMGQWVFKINGQEVSSLDLACETEMQSQRLHALRAQYGQYADMFFNNVNIPELAAMTVQQEELFNQAADTMGINLSEEYVSQKLHDPYFVFGELAGLVPYDALRNKVIDQSVLRQYLSRKGMSMRDFERKVERILSQRLVNDLVAVAAYAPSFEVSGIYAARHLDKKYSYLYLPLDTYVKQAKKEDVSKAELVSYYDAQNKRTGRYVVPEKRTGTVWVFDADSYGLDISDEKIERYYQEHKMTDEFQEKPAQVQVRAIVFAADSGVAPEDAKRQAQAVREELVKEPAKFAAKAKELSADSATREKGGLRAPFAKGETNSAVERAAFVLKNPGDISEVIETDAGFEVIQLVEKTARVVKPLSSVKASIRKKLLQRAFSSAFAADVQEAQHKKDQALEELISKKKAKKHTLDKVTLGQDRESQTLFGIRKAGESDFYVDERGGEHDGGHGVGVLVQLRDIEKEHIPALASIENKVQEDFYKDKARDVLMRDLKKISLQRKNQSWAQLQATFGGSTQTSDWIKAGDQEALKRFLPKNTPLKSLLRLENAGRAAIEITEDGGVIVAVEAIKELDEEQFKLKRRALAYEIGSKRKRVVSDGFVASLYKNATIETNDRMAAVQE